MVINRIHTRILWTGKPDVWISCWDNYENKMCLIGGGHKLIKNYSEPNMGYTNWKDKNNNDE
jgi:hypothetical protein